jgi:nitrite reductase/ring-hydroxylating ferredoxin subunit
MRLRTGMREIDTTRVLCSLAELDETRSPGFAIGEGDRPLRGFLVRTVAGVAAFVNYCPHAGHPLNFRPHKFLTSDRNLILCSSHGALFARDNGLCIAGPCAGQSLTPVPVEVISGYVLLAEGVDVERLANMPL